MNLYNECMWQKSILDFPCYNQPCNMNSKNIITDKNTTIKIKKKIYCCNFCNTHFNHIKNLKNHENTCKIIHITRRSKKEHIDKINDITPTIRELYDVVKILTDKVLELETELLELKKGGGCGAGGGNTRDVLYWLNNNIKPEKTYIDWLSNIRIKRENLQNVFDYSLSEAIILLLSEMDNIIPIRIFPNKKKIYIYSQDENQEYPRWNDNMTEQELHKFIDILCSRFLKEFISWNDQYKETIECDEQWKENYLSYTKKIMRTPTMSEKIYSRVKKFITRKLGEQ